MAAQYILEIAHAAAALGFAQLNVYALPTCQLKADALTFADHAFDVMSR